MNNDGLQKQFFPLLIGNSKLALHLHHYFHLLPNHATDYPHKHFNDARDLENPNLYRKISEVNAIWILTSDQSIESVYHSIKKEMRKRDLNPDRYVFLHSSAASEIEGMHTYHPLMTFGKEFYQLEQYEKIPFAVISSNPDALDSRFPLPNPIFRIEPRSRALYHSYAVLMSNLPILLWSLTAKEAKEKLSLDTSLFDPILKQTLSNFLTHRDAALTGPIARKDFSTIEKNLQALGESPLKTIYHAFLSPKWGGNQS